MESSKIFQAISDNNEEDLIKLLDDTDEDVNIRDSDGKTLLHMAVLKFKSVAAFKALLNKVNFTVRDSEGDTAIDLMFEDEEFPDDADNVFREFVKEKILGNEKEKAESLMLEGWLDLWRCDDDGGDDDEDKDDAVSLKKIAEFQAAVNNLHKWIKEGDLADVTRLLEADRQLIGAADRTGTLPMHKAAIFGQREVLEMLITEYPDKLELQDNMGRTVLHHAAGRDDEGQFYKMLTDAGADKDVKDITGKTPSEIHDNRDLLPGEITLEKINTLLEKPVLNTKKRKEEQGEDNSKDSKPPSPEAVRTPTPHTIQQPSPVQMYISPDVRPNPLPTTIDGRYVAETMGHALTLALAEIAERRPGDPVEYLAHWLYKYQENVDYMKQKQELLTKIREEEAAKKLEFEVREKRRLELQQMVEEERQRAEAKAEEQRKAEQEDVQRRAREAVLSIHPGLATVMEEQEDGTTREKPHKDERGQTELHKLAGESTADLTTLLNMGYSPADRDEDNRTARDIAEEAGVQENVDAIDDYVKKMVEMEEFDTLQNLLLAGYDKFDVVRDRLHEQTTSLPGETQQFLNDLPDFQEKISAVFRAAQTEGIRDLNQALDRKKLVEAKDKYGRSPLHLAVLAFHEEAVDHITKNFPVAMKCKDNLERSPLHYAMAISEGLAAMLESQGADTLALDVKQRSPSYYRENPEEIVSMQTVMQPATVIQAEQETSQQEVETQQQE